MCEANAYVYDENGNEILYLDNVDEIRPEEGKLLLRNLFGQQKLFDGEIKEISLIKHRILLGRKV
ncbi:MAG: CooT family nickel-binding protein [Candidatus Magnetobacterium sp. LHC-1]|uniref:CooT family nickel-binding protein n=1 Tax=Candidatus Magnetobacterium casense TaxID=1455061 RepID=UPI000590A211|nr:CooT family nickel-binding protein [Candidatus Magnetobacterium casensis]MBF0338800.1 CooT family nickel-binding protein [Nitrospirota bacterium]MBF0607603.1 CooT family nickel-binding protein [Nitrospirota bacterium]